MSLSSIFRSKLVRFDFSLRVLLAFSEIFIMQKETPSDAQLHYAAYHGNLELLKKVLDSGKVHVDCRDKDGTTPLILAAANGHADCVMELLEQGADASNKRLTGTTALFFAAQTGYLDVVNILLDNGAPVDSPSIDGGTPLFVACQCGHMSVAKELVKRGANVNIHMKDRATPLFIAAQNGHHQILLFLLSQGAEPDPRRTDGATPLWIASQMGHHHIVRELLLHGAQVDSTRHDGATPLFKAAHKGHSLVINELLKYKPSLDLLPVSIVCDKWLLDLGSPFLILLKNGESALHAAALFGHVVVVKQLIEAGADATLCNQEGMTPLQVAIQAKKTSVIEYLKTINVKVKAGVGTINGIVNGVPIMPIGNGGIKSK